MAKFLIGISGLPSCTKDYFRGIKLAKLLKIDIIELNFTRGIPISISLAKEIGLFASKVGVKLSIHAPYYINLCSERESVIRKSIEWIIKCIEYANVLNANPIVIHAAYYGSYGPTKCLELIEERLKIFEKYLEGTNIKIAIETMAKESQFGTLDEIVKLCKEFNYVIPCIDWAHIYIRNHGKINYDEITRFLETELNLENLYCHYTGIKDLSEEHVEIEVNNPPLEQLLQTLINSKFNEITIICESPKLEKDAIKMKSLLKKMLNTNGVK